ncbi:MAG: tRNA1(Val) (adenine(37)-N6)-methyltransferase [Christensenellaceae bacterium]|nr:tRNA1(Val) (adenine(37)-N6)-methyltransferase [Christensenellaceae bacterium]
MQTAGLRILQHPARFLFGTDSILLAHFAHAPKGASWMDLGTGTGILPLLILARRPLDRFDAVEIQADAADMAARSVALNGLEGRIAVHAMDMLDAPAFFGHGRFDAVVCNPPYGKRGCSLQNPSPAIAIARHEVAITLPQVVSVAGKLLKNGGGFFLIHQADRFLELAALLQAERLEPKRVRLLHPAPGKHAHLVLVEGVKLARAGVSFLSPLFIHEEGGAVSAEMHAIYAGEHDIL